MRLTPTRSAIVCSVTRAMSCSTLAATDALFLLVNVGWPARTELRRPGRRDGGPPAERPVLGPLPGGRPAPWLHRASGWAPAGLGGGAAERPPATWTSLPAGHRGQGLQSSSFSSRWGLYRYSTTAFCTGQVPFRRRNFGLGLPVRGSAPTSALPSADH